MIELFGKIHFAQPYWFWLWPGLLLSLVIGKRLTITEPADFIVPSPNSYLQYIHPLIRLLPKTFHIQRMNKLNLALFIFIMAIFTIALAQPYRIGQKLPDPPQERDITFIIDASVSMSLRDYVVDGQRIDRMSLVKAVLDKFIQKLKGERISLIVFGDQAYTLVPMTSDQYLLRQMLVRIQTTMAGRFNAMGAGIALAVQQAQAQPGRHRVLILVSDADQPTGDIDPLTASKLAKDANLPLYTIAIGASSAAAEEQRIGGLIYEPVNLTLLNSLSQITKARTYQASNADVLEQAMSDIATHTTNIQHSEPRYFHETLYHWPLLLAAALFTFLQLWQLFWKIFRSKASL